MATAVDSAPEEQMKEESVPTHPISDLSNLAGMIQLIVNEQAEQRRQNEHNASIQSGLFDAVRMLHGKLEDVQLRVGSTFSQAEAVVTGLIQTVDQTRVAASDAQNIAARASEVSQQANEQSHHAASMSMQSAQLAQEAAAQAARAAVAPGIPGPSLALNVDAQMQQPMFPMTVLQLPNLMSGVPPFDGANSSREGITAAEFLKSVEIAGMMYPGVVNQSTLVGVAVSRLKAGGLAWNWWSAQVAKAPNGQVPFGGDWQAFKAAFLKAMTGPDERFSLRVSLSHLQMKERDYHGYVGELRRILAKLEALNSPLSTHDAVYAFMKGLPPYLMNSVPLDAHDLEYAIAKVTDKHTKTLTVRSISDQARPSGADRARQGSRRYQYNNLEVDESGRGADHMEQDSADSDYFGAEEDDDLEYYNIERGQRRGRGRGSSSRGRGDRGRGARGPGRQFTPQQREHLKNRTCFNCGQAGHQQRDCPKRAAGDAGGSSNSKG